jgi:phage-related holin
MSDVLGVLARLVGTDAPFAALVKGLAFVGGFISAYVLDQEAERSAAVGACVVVLLDLVTGIGAAIHQGKPVTSRCFRRTVTKALGYFAVVILAAVIEVTITKSTQAPLVVGILWLVIAAEGLSVLENIRRMGIKVRFNALRRVLDGVVAEGEPEKEMP